MTYSRRLTITTGSGTPYWWTDPTKTSRIDDRFGPILEQGGYDQPSGQLSGGEKTSVALAYRLALNGTIREKMNVLDSNLLILDEPTDGFSREQMGKVHTVLGSLDAEQIIMVSHEAQLEGYVEHVFRVSKSGGRHVGPTGGVRLDISKLLGPLFHA